MSAKDHGRRYGDKRSYPLPLWNGVLEHRMRIGPALWVFLWLIDKVTSEDGGVGLVLGGQPIRLERLATDLEEAERSVTRHFKRLRAGGYIATQKTPYGIRVTLRNSCKFGVWSDAHRPARLAGHRTENPAKNGVTDGESPATFVRESRHFCPPETPLLSASHAKNGVNKEDNAVDPAKTQQETTPTTFERFYAAYPRKKAPAAAERAWRRVKPEEVPALMAALERQKLSDQWRRDGGRFIPYPATWLNQRRWEDEDDATGPQPRKENRAEERDRKNLEVAGFRVN